MVKSSLELFAFSTHTFDSLGQAEDLVDMLMGGPFIATRFGSAEPVRTSLASGGRAAAIALLRGAQGANAGSIFLAGVQPGIRSAIPPRPKRLKAVATNCNLTPAALAMPSLAIWLSLAPS